MIYSCFNDKSGMYSYFTDSKQIPINADLPIPSLPRAIQTIGVASVDAARPLPSDAVLTGQGWLPRGMIVKCSTQGLGDALTDAENWFTNGGWKWFVGGAAAMWIIQNI